MYLRQVTETGLPGLVGFLLFGSTFVLTIAVTFVEVFVLPPLADQRPSTSRTSSPSSPAAPSSATSGPCSSRVLVAAVGYLLGGLLFGLVLYRARVLARWASLLLAVGSVATSWFPSSPMPSTG